jgi:hypothetical protein
MRIRQRRPGPPGIKRSPHAALGRSDQPMIGIARVHGNIRYATALRSRRLASVEENTAISRCNRRRADIDPTVALNGLGGRRPPSLELLDLPERAQVGSYRDVAQRVGALLEFPPRA